MAFYWGLSDSMSLQVSRTLLSILANLHYAVVWMVSVRPLISKSSSPCINPLVTVPRAPITIGIIVSFTFCSFFNSLARSRYLFFFSLSFNLLRSQPGQQSPQFGKFSFFFWLIIIRSGRLAEIRSNYLEEFWNILKIQGYRYVFEINKWMNR